MLKKIVLIGSLLLVSFSAVAFDLPKIGGGDKGASSGNIEADVADFVAKSTQMRDIAYNSMLTIVAAYADEKELAALKAKDEEISKKTDPQENGAAKAAQIKTLEAKLAEYKNQKDIGEKTKALTAEKQKKVATSLFNFAIAALNAPVLMDKGQKIVSGVSLTSIGKVLPVKDSLPMLADFVKYGAGTISGFANIAKGANIEVKATTATSAPESTNPF